LRFPGRFFAWSERFITWKRSRNYSLGLLILYSAACFWVLTGNTPPLNRSGQPIGGDFIAFYAAARVVTAGDGPLLYDSARVAVLQRALLDGRAGDFYDAFRNPPFFALLYVPLTPLDLLPAYVVWLLVSCAFLIVAIRILIAEVPALAARGKGLLVIALAFPPVFFGLIDGENSTLSLLLYALLFRAVARDDQTQFGIWAAVGLFKPQLFLVLPLVMLARRWWRGLAAYVGVAVILAAVSFAIVGPSGAQGWLRILVEPESTNTLANGWRMSSLKSLLDVLGPSIPLFALIVYVLGACLLALSVVALWARREGSVGRKWVFTCLAAVLIDPHLVDYDLTVLVAAGAVLPLAGALLNRWWLVALYLTTLFRLAIPLGFGELQLTSLILCVLAVLSLLQQEAPLGLAFRRLLPART
jgi:hypothetical protein